MKSQSIMNLGPTTAQLHLKALNSLSKAPPPPKSNGSSSSSSSTPARPQAKSAPAKAKPVTKAISIQHMTVQKAKSNQRLLYDIINYLRDVEKPVSAENIHEATGHDIKTVPGLFETLQSNVKISYDEGWFSYKPPFSVKNIHELHDLINKTPDGIEVSELKDCYKTVDEDLKKLKEQNDIVTILNTDTKSEIVYPNDPRYRIAVADDFKKIWLSVRLPDSDVDLEREMRASGIAVVEEEEDKGPRKRPSTKKDKKRKKILKYTNTHIIGNGIDLSKDFVPENKK